jgi:hypothetical protein
LGFGPILTSFGDDRYDEYQTLWWSSFPPAV